MKRKLTKREGTILTSVAWPPKLYRQVVLTALEDDMAAQELVREAVREYLNRRRPKKGKTHAPAPGRTR